MKLRINITLPTGEKIPETIAALPEFAQYSNLVRIAHSADSTTIVIEPTREAYHLAVGSSVLIEVIA